MEAWEKNYRMLIEGENNLLKGLKMIGFEYEGLWDQGQNDPINPFWIYTCLAWNEIIHEIPWPSSISEADRDEIFWSEIRDIEGKQSIDAAIDRIKEVISRE